jgi:hypothetical protein
VGSTLMLAGAAGLEAEAFFFEPLPLLAVPKPFIRGPRFPLPLRRAAHQQSTCHQVCRRKLCTPQGNAVNFFTPSSRSSPPA